ncbi:Peptidase C48 SUMO Sentrin Ubl1 [Pyrenophora seminiperda CCB06]|uniref:Peptidase C48 SUMO Sentrin Ubl1 n=1 Tax=Pyrenophora seminiperda CCB06 TaxID=1302712 RepID=A0A3M7ME96_9PLEO|nr:Peptidase C48 SUMO Sentrin Ubl1 [Pyrenophora seminiperda CCB06]
MSNKRAYSAYLSSDPADRRASVHGFGASHFQVIGFGHTGLDFSSRRQQAQQRPPLSISRIRVPGAWPDELSFSDDGEDEVAPARNTSIFTTLGKWAVTASITNLCALPARLIGRFLRRQQIKAIPIISSSGGNKRRFIAAGALDYVATPSPSIRARANQSPRSVQHNQTRAAPGASRPWHRLFSPQRLHDPTHVASQSTTPLATAPAVEELHTPPHFIHGSDQELDEYFDTSIDFSFDDVLTSTPPRNPQTGSPIHVPWNSPRLSPPVQNQSLVASPLPWVSSHGHPSISQGPQGSTTRSREPVAVNTRYQRTGRGSHTGRRSHTNAPAVTPVRRQLVKLQLGAQYKHPKAQRQINIHTGSPAKSPAETEPSPTEVMSHASASQLHTNICLEPNISPPDSSFEYANDLSFLLDAPTPSPRRGVKWASHAGTKSFYYDERVSEMLDSTLETISSSPAKAVWDNFPVNNQIADDDHATSSGASSATNSPQLTAQHDSDNNDGFHGIPAHPFDVSDDSLEESQLSLELVEDLQNDIKTKLALAPPPPPPPKPLITPLSPEETVILEDAAANTCNGLKSDKWVIDQRLYARDFGTLLPHLFNGSPRAWLNDNIVNEYLSIIVAAKKKEAGFEHKPGGPAPPVHAFSSFWYTTADTSRWSGKCQLKGKQYLDAQLILYPICDGGHWRLLAVYPRDRSIEYLDSLGLDGQKYIDKLIKYLEKELGDLFIPSEWSKDTAQRSSLQMNGSDCGVFTLLNALVLLRGDDTSRVLPTNGMDDARKRIAATLLAGRPTAELD